MSREAQIAERVAASMIAKTTDRQRQVMDVVKHDRAKKTGNNVTLTGLEGEAINAVIFKNGSTWVTRNAPGHEPPDVLKMSFDRVMQLYG